jgi:hypothetical protein
MIGGVRFEVVCFGVRVSRLIETKGSVSRPETFDDNTLNMGDERLLLAPSSQTVTYWYGVARSLTYSRKKFNSLLAIKRYISDIAIQGSWQLFLFNARPTATFSTCYKITSLITSDKPLDRGGQLKTSARIREGLISLTPHILQGGESESG